MQEPNKYVPLAASRLRAPFESLIWPYIVTGKQDIVSQSRYNVLFPSHDTMSCFPVTIGNSQVLQEYDDKILFIPLAWNFYYEIKNRIKGMRQNDDDRFYLYFGNYILES